MKRKVTVMMMMMMIQNTLNRRWARLQIQVLHVYLLHEHKEVCVTSLNINKFCVKFPLDQCHMYMYMWIHFHNYVSFLHVYILSPSMIEDGALADSGENIYTNCPK